MRLYFHISVAHRPLSSLCTCISVSAFCASCFEIKRLIEFVYGSGYRTVYCCLQCKLKLKPKAETYFLQYMINKCFGVIKVNILN